MSYKLRLMLLIIIDSMIVSFSIYMSHFFLNPYAVTFDDMILLSSIILLIGHHVFSYALGLYRRVWRYASLEELRGIFLVVTLSVLLAAAGQFIIFNSIYERALVVTWMLHILLIGGVRFAWRYMNTYGLNLFPKKVKKRDMKNRTLIIGAGSAGRMLARQYKENQDNEFEVVGFIDDDFTLHHLTISGLPVFGSTKDLKLIVEKKDINHIVIAMPSVEKSRIKHIVQQAKAVCHNVQILPMIEDLVLGNVSVNQVRDVSIEDLLGREPVELDIDSISDYIENKTVLVTGAGGSIGSEICRQVSKFNPKKLILLGHGENSIYQIDMELRQHMYDMEFEIVPVIGDIQDRERMFEVMKEHQPHVVYHAAAHKHVPLMEYNPKEAVKNNVIGTKNVAEAANANSVHTFVLISSDKAVNPTNVMGATKRVAEMVIQSINEKSDTKFVAVRFGNVLGSRGSVIPLFKKQIANGGPVTVTHPDMTRYFMTIPEASRLVIQAGALAKGGEIFVLDMGEPVKIVDLAKNLIKLSGYDVDEIGITYTGIRPGEKMFEELLSEEEVNSDIIFPKIHIGKSQKIDIEKIKNIYERFHNIDNKDLKKTLLELANNHSVPNKIVR